MSHHHLSSYTVLFLYLSYWGRPTHSGSSLYVPIDGCVFLLPFITSKQANMSIYIDRKLTLSVLNCFQSRLQWFYVRCVSFQSRLQRNVHWMDNKVELEFSLSTLVQRTVQCTVKMIPYRPCPVQGRGSEGRYVKTNRENRAHWDWYEIVWPRPT